MTAAERDRADPLAVIEAARILPVLTVEDAGSAADLGRALLAGGLPVAEVTFRTPAAAAALREMAAVPGLCVGAGTVVREEQVDEAVAAGARFVVEPGLSPGVVHRARELGVPVIPGVATPTELISALDLGADVVKLFPAAQLGGPAAVAALAAPFPGVRFVPTGGVTREQAGDYLAHPSVVAVGGSWMVPKDLVREARWDEVTRLVRESVETVTKQKERTSGE